MQQPPKPKPQPAPVKVPSPKQSKDCELDRLMALFDKV